MLRTHIKLWKGLPFATYLTPALKTDFAEALVFVKKLNHKPNIRVKYSWSTESALAEVVGSKNQTQAGLRAIPLQI